MVPGILRSGLAAALLLAAGVGEAAPIPTLWNTGFDAAGVLITPGSSTPDAHYKLITSPGAFYGPDTDAFVLQDKDQNGNYVFPFDHPWWHRNSAGSQWISPTNVLSPLPENGPGDTGSHKPGTYVYRTMFSLAGFIPATAVLELYWESDNDGNDPAATAIWLNGALIPGSSACCKYQFTGPITVTSGFAPGWNTLDFYVDNRVYEGGGNPTGVRVEAFGRADVAPVPEPGTLLLVGSAALGAGTLVRRLRRRT